MIVMKFGGTSIGSVEAINRVLKHISLAISKQKPILLVISALSEVTNQLTTLADTKEEALLTTLYERHLAIAKTLIKNPSLLAQFSNDLDNYLWGLKQDLLNDEQSLDIRLTAKIIAYGELLSSTLIHYVLMEFNLNNLWIDVRNLIITNYEFLNAEVNFDCSIPYIQQELSQHFEAYPIVLTQGFIASTPCGLTSLLGREGSDYSATILGTALGAEEIQIWTDVDGIMTTDPKVVPTAQLIEHLTYDEASELSALGAKIIHPLTINPAKLTKTPVRILNSKNLNSQSGSLIGDSMNKKFVSINYHKNIVTLRFQIKSKSTLTKLGVYLSQHKNNIYFSSLSGNQILIIMQKESWDKLSFAKKNWETIEEKSGNLIAITMGGENSNWVELLGKITPLLEQVEELFFSTSKKSLIITLPDGNLNETLNFFHHTLVK